MDTTTAPVIKEYPVPYLWALLLISISIGIFIFIEQNSAFSNIKSNFGEYRCQPLMMPFVGLFGYDTNENFQFCLNQIIQDKTQGVTAPFAQGMSGFIGILSNLMNSINSFRVTLATLVGGILKIISEFKARMTALMGRVKLTASRMKAMMYRVYGTMTAVMFMGISAQTGIANFGDTFIFKFIDTFCFPPEQLIELESGKSIPISEIKIGDILKGSISVESTYTFLADGQPMVQIGSVKVSSNHFIKYNNKWILSKDHPEAISIGGWSGSPLHCLTTDTHRIPVNDYIFSDYDETDEANSVTQAWVDKSLNGRITGNISKCSYEIGSPSDTRIKTLNGYLPLSMIKLGDPINKTARVVGIQNSTITEYCILPGGQKVATGTLLWNSLTNEWTRASILYSKHTFKTPVNCIALFVSPGAQYELEGKHIVRDAMEIYSPDTKEEYAKILLSKYVI